MEETIGINLELPKDFSLQLDRMIIDLKEVGISTSKAKLIIKFAEIGYLNEKRECDKIVNNFRNGTQE
jgi:hypothetical protein